MTITLDELNEAMNMSCGSENWYKHSVVPSLVFTDGVHYVRSKAGAYWLVDLVASYMPAVLKAVKELKETFFVVRIETDDEQIGLFTITREEWTEEGDVKTVDVVRQNIEHTDLPAGADIKFFLELAQLDPVVMCLLCPSEH